MKKIMFITYDFPYPTNTGGKNRAFNLIKHAIDGNEIHLVSFVRADFKEEYKEYLTRLGVKSITIFERRKLSSVKNLKSVFSKNSTIFKSLYYDKNIEKKILELIEKSKIDIVHFESYYTAFYMSDKIRELNVKQIFGTENIEHFLYRDYAKNSNIFKRLILDFEVRKIEKEELELLKLADRCIAVTHQEASFIKKITGKDCDVIENGVDLQNFKYKSPHEKILNKILFIGNFTYFPNVDAINYFYSEVFKKLDSKIKLMVVGKKADSLKLSKDARVECYAFVKDVRDVYRGADIMISPIRIGGGTNFKILEAMAIGIPIIANPIRVESLGLKNNEHILFAKNAQEFIDKIDELLNSHDLRVKLARAAREEVEKKYSWVVIGKKLNNIWQKI